MSDIYWSDGEKRLLNCASSFILKSHVFVYTAFFKNLEENLSF